MAEKPSVACAVLHTDRSGNPVPCPGYPDPTDNPCYVHGMGSPHDAHDRTDGRGHCPGYSEPDDGTKEPAPPQTIAEQVRDLERTIERVREAVGTDLVLISCEEHAARIESLESSLRGVLGMFEKEIEQRRIMGALSINTVRRWHNTLDGTDQEGRPA